MLSVAKLGLTGRLYAAVAAVTVALFGAATYTASHLGNMDAIATQTGSVRVPQLQRMAAIELNVTRASLQLRHAMLSRTPEERAATLADVGRLRGKIDELMADYEKAIVAPAARQRFEAIKPAAAQFWVVGGENIALIKDEKIAEAFAFLVDRTIPARNNLLKEIAETVKLQENTLASDIDEFRQDAANTRNVFLALVATISLGLIALAWYVGAALRARVAVVQQTTERVRDGDFTQSIHDARQDEFTALIKTMGEMQSALTRVVTDVRANAENVATASAEIAQGNQDLSSRTEQQASSLQETAATMDELGATVRQNAENAQQANQLAQAASGIARKGGDVVGDVVNTMKGISDSSRRIADIISTIDGIAFQTNILALNAAVEAARAGEQGRGFAVVASEVRSLAQRAAAAAKEIKGLITDSVERVEQGTAQVSLAGQTMDEVVASIRRVADIVGEISSASAEQSSGVAQVGQSVTQMDQTTQQNAALVEQSAAAAESLKTQAAALVQAVSVFQLPQNQGQRAHSPPRAAKPVTSIKAAARPVAPPLPAQAASGPGRSAPSGPPVAARAVATSAATSDDWTSF